MNRSTLCPALFTFVAMAGACGGSQTPVATPVASASPAPSVATSASSAPPRPETPDAPFRAQPPEPLPTPAFHAPVIESFTLANHLRVLLVERNDLPIVRASYITRHGGDASGERPGLASLVGALLETGTRTRSALELSDAFAAIGADHHTFMTTEGGGVIVKVLTPNLGAAIDLLADVTLNPSFAPDEIERLRARRLAAIQQEADSPRVIGANVAARVVFGDTHPYGHSEMGTEESVRAITRVEIQRFYATHFAPTDAALIVTGNVTRAQIEPLLAHTFGGWHARASAHGAVPVAPTPAPHAPRIVLVDRPGAPQSSVSVVHVGAARANRDYIPIMVMNTILGGMFSSRINLNLREAHAYTYGARSGFDTRRGAGLFGVFGAIVTAATAPAVHEIFAELQRIRTENVSEAELALARARLAESLPARFETGGGVLEAVSEMFLYDLPLDEYATFAARVNAVTVADVRRVAQTYLDPDHARVVIVGARAQIESDLRGLGIGEIEVRNVHGDLQGGTPAPARSGAPPALNTHAHPHAH